MGNFECALCPKTGQEDTAGPESPELLPSVKIPDPNPERPPRPTLGHVNIAGDGKAVGGVPTIKVKEGGISKAHFIFENSGKIEEFYETDKKKLGEGSYGVVRKAKHKISGHTRAVKSILKSKLKNFDRLKREIAIMKIMTHPNIVKLYETFEDYSKIYLVMELCQGGELLDRIIEAVSFNEEQASIIVKQIVGAVYYMHGAKVCHRDLKPENFLFTTRDPIEKCTLKIIDFGLSVSFTDGQTFSSRAGTPFYVAPQVLNGSYGKEADLWSCGVIMFCLLCGYPPFFAETDQGVLQKVRAGTFTFDPTDWKDISQDAKSLVKQLLKINPKERLTAEQALNDVWIKNKAPASKQVPLGSGLVKHLRGLRSNNKLKTAALHVIATTMSEEQIQHLKDMFVALDKNGDGSLSIHEMTDALDGDTDIPKDIVQIFHEMDADGSGSVDYTEFIAATLDAKEYETEDVCWNAFRNFDRNGDGQISHDELMQVLGDPEVSACMRTDPTKILEECDRNGDGQINFDEFVSVMRKPPDNPLSPANAN